MSRVLIAGESSYVGTNIRKYLENYSARYKVNTISLRNPNWKETKFNCDVVILVAGIAHIKETKENSKLYYEINRDLAYEAAVHAKESEVSQFIFFSSMSVYGRDSGFIDESTPVNPKSSYGKSKYQAELLIDALASECFTVSIVRPPLIYGRECRGNYTRISNLMKYLKVFPDYKNHRSMIYIDNLSEFVRLLIDYKSPGVFYPQNEEYVCTADLVKTIAEARNSRVFFTGVFNPLIKRVNITVLEKMFGDLVYDKKLSSYYGGYNRIKFKESVIRTEMGEANE